MSDLPTTPGVYWWREKDGDDFQLVRVEMHIYNRNPDVVHLSFYSGEEMRMLPIKDMKGQWLQIPTADELVELQACKKMVDEGHEAWAVKCPAGQLAHTGTQDECSRKCADLNAADMFLYGREYTYIKVRVCMEVENEKGKE